MIDFARFSRFLLAGLVNTGFGLAVYTVCILLGFEVWAALLTSVVTGVIFNFFNTGRFVFGSSKLALLPRFILCYAMVYSLNLYLIDLLKKVVTSSILAQAILCLPMALVSYCLLAALVFRPRGEA